MTKPLTPSISGTDPPIASAQHAAPGLARRILHMLAVVWRAHQARRERERLRVAWDGLSERELTDIGIARGEIEHLMALRALDQLRDRADWP